MKLRVFSLGINVRECKMLQIIELPTVVVCSLTPAIILKLEQQLSKLLKSVPGHLASFRIKAVRKKINGYVYKCITVKNILGFYFSFTGPCLKIEDTVLKWVKGHHQGDRVVKATYILIEGLVGDMISNYIYLQNCGTTSIRYHWSVSRSSTQSEIVV